MRSLLLAISLLTPLASASGVTLSLAQPDLTGLPGSTVGWGFSLVNDTPGYLVITSVQSTFANAPVGLSATNPAVEDYLSNWMVNNAFALAPGATLTQAFSQTLGEGLAAFAIAPGASGMEAGTLIATYLLFDADPFSDPDALAFPDPAPLYVNARVTAGGAAAPEPSTWLLMGLGLVWLMRRRLVIALGLAACVFGQLPGIDGVPADGAFPPPVVASGQSCS